MPNVVEASKTPVEDPESEGTWIQITFTLDTEHYKMLWKRAAGENRTIPDFVRENTIDFLGEI